MSWIAKFYTRIVTSLSALRSRQGLSRKLLALFVIIAVTFLLIVGASFGNFFKYHFKNRIQPHFIQYLDYVKNDIGEPADYKRAYRLSKRLKMDIAIVDSRGLWVSAPGVFPASLADSAQWDIDFNINRRGIEFGELEIARDDFMAMKSGETLYVFHLERLKHSYKKPRALVPLLLLLIILFVLYLAIRKLFSPILDIQNGVRKIGEGQLDHRITIRRKDELGVLADDINDMADKLQKILDAKRQMLLAVSHELRTPLTRSNVALEMLEDSAFKEQIKSDIQEMESLIADILESERLNTPHNVLDKQETELNQLCHDVIAQFFSDGDIYFESSSDTIIALVDAARVRLLLKNLVGNAHRYQDNQTQLKLLQDEQFTTLIVRDDGEGIPEEDIPFLTEPFYRVDPARQRQTGGYGLGLYLCRMIVEAHGGELTISSELGKGTEVSVSLPVIKQANS